MDTFISILLLIGLLVVAWIIARYILKVTGCVLYGVLTAILAIGIVIILLVFLF